MLFGHRLPVKLVISDLAHFAIIKLTLFLVMIYSSNFDLKNGRLVGHYKIPS